MNLYRVIFFNTAKQGMLNIVDYIALDNPVRAISFVEELTTSLVKTLSVFPLAGKATDDLGLDEEIRIMPYKNYNSYYRVLEDQKIVEVLYIFNASQNVSSIE